MSRRDTSMVDLVILTVMGAVVLLGAVLLVSRVAKASRPDDPLWRMRVSDEAHAWLRSQRPKRP